MAFRKVPSCTEVCTWSPDTLIEYFKTCNLKDCEKMVKKQGIDGKRFLEMSETDMQKFPKTRVPMLIKIQQEINKKEKKGLFPSRSETQRGYSTGKLHGPYPPTSYDANQSESWEGSDTDSFDSDYENPDEPDNEDYESPAPEDEDSGTSDGYESPPSNNDFIPVNSLKPSSSNPDYIDRPIPNNSAKYPPNPPVRPEVSPFPLRGNTFPGVQPSLEQDNPRLQKPKKPLGPNVDRTTKPTMQGNAGKPLPTSGKTLPGQAKAVTLPPSIRPTGKPEALRKPALPNQPSGMKSSYSSHIPHSEDVPSPDLNDPRRLFPSHHSNTFPSTSPKPSIRNMGSNTLPTSDICHSASPLQAHGGLSYPPYKPEGSPNGRPPAPIPSMPYNSTSANEDIHSEKWYFGNMSRREAENALRYINMDGTFLVRNCSQSTTSLPYVLMVLYRNKVYNVRIRYDQNNEVYLLGSGGHETFDSVSEIIDFFCKNPLLLIDGKDRGSRQHCKLACIADSSFIK
ncbi:lymphocyte cytosolic protein 2 [Leptodactylus fuscus]|uniref:lymphocyte cytosolic protein 2 n=1 Tax=Leptodactylus fuscus TaxID=238119 RepID=UPI003F4F00C5